MMEAPTRIAPILYRESPLFSQELAAASGSWTEVDPREQPLLGEAEEGTQNLRAPADHFRRAAQSSANRISRGF
jgi:ferric-dicitrate binding protein FerR (iron transport regulator)